MAGGKQRSWCEPTWNKGQNLWDNTAAHSDGDGGNVMNCLRRVCNDVCNAGCKVVNKVPGGEGEGEGGSGGTGRVLAATTTKCATNKEQSANSPQHKGQNNVRAQGAGGCASQQIVGRKDCHDCSMEGRDGSQP